MLDCTKSKDRLSSWKHLRVEGRGDRMSHKSECTQKGRSDAYLDTFQNHTVSFLWLLTEESHNLQKSVHISETVPHLSSLRLFLALWDMLVITYQPVSSCGLLPS